MSVPTRGLPAKGSLIYIGDGASPEVFTKINGVFSISGDIGISKPKINYTDHDTEEVEEYELADIGEGKSLQIQANEMPGDTSQEKVWDAHDDETRNNWKIIARSGKTWIFPGLVLDCSVDLSNIKDKQILKWTLDIAGTITRTNPA